MFERNVRGPRRGPIDKPAETGKTRLRHRDLTDDGRVAAGENPLDLLAKELTDLGVSATVTRRSPLEGPPYLRVGGAEGENILCVGGRFEYGFGSPIGLVTDVRSAALAIQMFLEAR